MRTSAGGDHLIGRDDLLDALVRQVVHRDDRLVTLHGRAGVGKTTVALAFLECLAGPRRHVSMKDAGDRAEYVARLGRELDLTEITETGVVLALGAEPSVLLLDGCGALDVARTTVEWLLDSLPQLTLLVTSPEPLGMGVERAVPVPPMELAAADETDSAVVAAAPAVALFLRRAEQALPTFEPADEDVLRIAEVCERLDGLPEAICLAAARIAIMEPVRLLAEMSSLGAWELVGLSIDDELERTVKLLDEPTRQVLLALATMAGDASLAATAAVADVSPADVGEALSSLVDLQLARVDQRRGRFTLSSSARAFVLARSEDDPGWTDRRARHAVHLASEARQASRRSNHAPADRSWMLDHQNRLRAITWLREHGRMEDALRLAVDTMPGFVYRGDPETGRQLLGDVLRGCPASARGSYIEAHLWLGRLEAERADGEDPVAAQWHFDMAVRVARERGDPWILIEALNVVMENHALLDDGAAVAERTVGEALELTAAPGLEIGRAVFLCWHAGNLERRGRSSEAAEAITESISIARTVPDRRLLLSFGIMYWHLPSGVRPVGAAVPSLPELREIAETQGDFRTVGWVLTVTAGNALGERDDRAAVRACLEMTSLAIRTDQGHLARQGLFGTVRILKERGDAELRALLVGALASRRASIALSVRPEAVVDFDAAATEARRSLGGRTFDRVFREGAGLDLWQAVGLARERLETVATEMSPTPGQPSDPVDALTERERQVLAALTVGRSNKEIAVELGMRPKTVAHHCAAIYQKLGVSNRTQAAGFGAGLVAGYPGHLPD